MDWKDTFTTIIMIVAPAAVAYWYVKRVHAQHGRSYVKPVAPTTEKESKD